MSADVGEVEFGHLSRSVYSGAIAAAVLIAVGVVLRLAFLGTDSFWLDEAYTVTHVVPLTFAQIWRVSPDPTHPPLYFVVVKAALRLFGVSEASARFPSALASLANLVLVGALGRRLGLSAKACGTAIVLLALAPLDVWYAREARMYELVTTMALTFATALTFTSWTGAVFAGLALAVGLYVDFTMVALFALVTSLWLVRWWYTGRKTRELMLLGAASLTGWLLFLPEWAHLGEVLGRINTVPVLVSLRKVTGVEVTPGIPAVLTLMLLAAAIAVATAIAWSSLADGRHVGTARTLTVSAFLAVTIAAAIPRAYSAKQFLATGWPFMTLIVGWFVTDSGSTDIRVRTKNSVGWMVPVMAAISLMAAIVAVITPRADWRDAVSYLNQRAVIVDSVWLDPPWNAIPYGYYAPVHEAKTTAVPSAQITVAADRETCVIAERFGSAPPTSATEAWLDAHAKMVDAKSFPRLEVRCYSAQ